MSAVDTATPGADREERYRLAILTASAPLMVLIAPVLLPFSRDRSLLEEGRRDPAGLAIVLAIFAWPLLVGGLGLRQSLVRRAPGKAAFGVPAVLHILAAAGIVLLLVVTLAGRSRARESPGIWVALVAAVGMLYVLARGFRRAGWERWGQLVAGVWLMYALSTLVVALDISDVFDPPEIGGWLLLFGLGAAAPAVAWILSPKRG